MVNITVTTTEKNSKTYYGIEINDDDQTFSYPYLSENRSEAEKIADNFRSNDISPVHYNEIISDYLMGKAYDDLISNALA